MAVDIKYGFGSAVGNSIASLNKQSLLNGSVGIFSYRVKSIILDDTHPRFKEFGEWNSIGTIFVVSVLDDSPSTILNIFDLAPAFPLFPNIKHYPLLEEIVSIVQLSDAGSQADLTNTAKYYLPPINIWNSQIHNALPSPSEIKEQMKNSDAQDYIAAESGSLRRIVDSSTDIVLGTTFNEPNVINNQPLLPFEGDIIYEGRFGNSIRLGSTVKNSNNTSIQYNPWSNFGKSGDPILILRNGQGTLSVDYSQPSSSWVPTVEDINLDKSSIYLTSTQQINLKPSSYFKTSYSRSTPPSPPNRYEGSQILLNSGRIFFNTKNDSIILTSADSVGVNANTSINFEAQNEIELTAPKVYLGSANGTEDLDIQSVVLGENLMTNLKNLMIVLKEVSFAMNNASYISIDPVTKKTTDISITSLKNVSAKFEAICDDILKNIDLQTKPGGMLSNIVKTK